jgi:hypothetical protein
MPFKKKIKLALYLQNKDVIKLKKYQTIEFKHF